MSETLNEALEQAKGLRGKQKTFIEHYLINFNATESAKLAGYSERSAEVQGHKLVNNPTIKAIIDAELEIRRQANKATAEKVIEELSELAFNDREINKKDKLKALELLGRHFAVFTEKVETVGEQKIKITLPPELQSFLNKSDK